MTQRSPLHALHAALGARFTDFGGWEMPVQYAGTLSEHQAVRTRAGIFDVTHLGRFALEGEGAVDALRHLLCNDVADIEPGRAQYTMMLDDSGGVVDDIIVWRFDVDEFWVMPNAANQQTVMDAFSAAGTTATMTPLQDTTVFLAVQGPHAPELIERVLGVRPKRFRTATPTYHEVPLWMAGTGYTGEPGAEVAAPPEVAAALFEAFVEAGATPCGLGARDTLRLEMGYPLWGQDLDRTITPLEAGLEWVVDWDHDFVGRAALDAARRNGLAKSRLAFVMPGRRAARHDYAMRAGASSGTVSSGAFSPVLERGIGMGYLSPPHDGVSPVEVDVRGTWEVAEVVDLPFVER